MDPSIPDLFADVVDIAGGAYGLSLTFRASDPERPGDAGAAATVARIRVTPALARTLAVILGEAAQQVGAGNTAEPLATKG
jgi:hypothetical protein